MTAVATGGQWVMRPVPRPSAAVRLICIHAAGSGPAMFRPWPAALPDHVEVLLLQLPGREARIAEPPIDDYKMAVTAARHAVQPYLDRPWALFGHSMGARIGFGLIESLIADGDALPRRLFASGCPAPHIPAAAGEHRSSSDEHLLDELRRLGGTPAEALREPKLVELILPTLRADLRVCTTATVRQHQALPVPITVLGGADDDIPMEQLTAWSRWSSAGTEVLLFMGGHFFLTGRAQPQAIGAVTARLSDRAATP
jgi:surfactin synthase thioesterase subunit